VAPALLHAYFPALLKPSYPSPPTLPTSQVRRRSIPGEAPKPRTFREAAAAVKLGARISGALGALRRTTGQGGSGAVDRLLASAVGAMGSSNLGG
jgi:hypothetical protein